MASITEKPKLKLYSYWRSSCAWRVRIALFLKGLDYDYLPVNLLKKEHLGDEFLKLNPLGYVPVLVDEDVVIADSFAIIMYLETKYPEHPLLPEDIKKRALSYQVANIVASNIQPLQNVSVLNYIEDKLGSDERLAWVQHHVKKGFAALEKLLQGHAGKYAIGDEVTFADVFLSPQIASYKRFNIDMAEFPLLKKLEGAYDELPAFQKAVPEKQPDAAL